MSVVCARVYGDKVVMAADSIVCRGDMKRTNGNIVKLREVNGMGVGGVVRRRNSILCSGSLKLIYPPPLRKVECKILSLNSPSRNTGMTGITALKMTI